MSQRVMVKIEDGNPWRETVLTYEVEGHVEVGDEVLAPIRDETYFGKVVSIGTVAWNGHEPYLGPCRIATVMTGGTDASSS